MAFNYNLFSLAVIMSFIDAIMMSITKIYYISETKLKITLVIGMLIYMLQPLLFYKALSYEGIGIFNVLWDSVSNLVVLFIGVIIFKENVSIKKYIGVLLSFISIYFLSSN